MQHLQRFAQMVAVTPARAYVLAGTGHTAVGGVEVHLVGVLEITQHAHALEHMDVFAVIGDAREVIEISSGRVAILFLIESAIITAAPAVQSTRELIDPDRIPDFAEREVAFGVLECCVDHGARHLRPSSPRTAPTASQVSIQWGVASLKPTFENTVDILDDGFEVLIGRMVAATAFTGPHRLMASSSGALRCCRACLPPPSRHRQVP